MRFLLRHPIFILFILGIGVLTYLVFDKVQEQPANAGFAGFRGGPGMRQATLVTVEEVTQQVISDQVESIGTAIANESVNVTAKVSETISKVHFEDGEFVSEGDILIELTNADEASRLAEALASANDARRQLTRIESLVAANLVASTEVDQARTNVETAEARLEGVMVAMEDRLVRAPFSGLLGFRSVSAGTLLSPNTVITTLDDVSLIKLDFTIPEVYLSDVAVGQTIHAKSIVYNDRAFSGQIRVVGSRVDPVTRSVSIRAHLANPDGTLRPGMLLTVALELNEHQATVIPEQSVIASQGSQHVFVIGPDNVAERVEVELGRRRPGYVEVLAGLTPGQMVVTEGVAQVRPGLPVRILDSNESEPSRLPDTTIGS